MIVDAVLAVDLAAALALFEIDSVLPVFLGPAHVALGPCGNPGAEGVVRHALLVLSAAYLTSDHGCVFRREY